MLKDIYEKQLIFILTILMVALFNIYIIILKLFLDVNELWTTLDNAARNFDTESKEAFRLISGLAKSQNGDLKSFETTQRRLRREIFVYKGIVYQSSDARLTDAPGNKQKFVKHDGVDRRRHPNSIFKDDFDFGNFLKDHINAYVSPQPYCRCQSKNICRIGRIGIRGRLGPNGPPGLPGKDGLNGVDAPYFRNAPFSGCVFCPSGAPGVQGEAGKPGARGKRGPMGSPGRPGQSGMPGLPGEIGAVGERGVMGKIGVKGEPGMHGRRVLRRKGVKGQRGEPGVEGEKGSAGMPGLVGRAGPKGVRGPLGMSAADGARGQRGEQGAEGKHGKDALYCNCPIRKKPYWLRK